MASGCARTACNCALVQERPDLGKGTVGTRCHVPHPANISCTQLRALWAVQLSADRQRCARQGEKSETLPERFCARRFDWPTSPT